MSYSKQNKEAGQSAYHEARKFGHTKEEARGIRDNWKPSSSRSSSSSDDDDDDDEYYTTRISGGDNHDCADE
jgi:hypothetical protein